MHSVKPYLRRLVLVTCPGFWLGFCLGFCPALYAEPYLAIKNNQKCSACHIDANGGGARNGYGAFYGSQVLPQSPGNTHAFDSGEISESFRLGADFRFNYSWLDQEYAEQQQSFGTQSGQLYVTLQPKGGKFLLHIDEQVMPGGALNRQAFVVTRLNDHHSLKAGTFILPYGLRVEDDSAYMRQASQINFDSNDNGAEWAMEYNKLLINLAVTNGSASQTNDDTRMAYTTRGEYLGSNWRVGAGYLLNDAAAGELSLANIFGGFHWSGFVFMFELGRIEDTSISNIIGESQTQWVNFFEVNKEVAKGYNLKVTSEYLDPDGDIKDNERRRHSLLLEYTPFAHMQVRGGLRFGDDIPIAAGGDTTDAFVQLHFYY